MPKKPLKKTLFFLILFLLQPLSLTAKKLYKYQDKQGIWHYSDVAPKTSQKVEVRQLKAAGKRFLWLEKTGDKHKPAYYLINNYAGPVEVEITLKQQQNAHATPRLPKRFIVQPGQSKILFKVNAKNEYKSWRYSLHYHYIIGSPLASHADETAYSPPLAKNATFRISQAFGGKFSHTDPQNRYAVDIAMPEGTPIHAARSGRVIEVNNDYQKGGTIKSYKSRANSVRILHDDGSMAIYAHLALEKAQVYPGLQVSTGQLIAYSGNTGYSSGPHLHFAVQLNKGMELASVPFLFKGSDGVPYKPQPDTWLEN